MSFKKMDRVKVSLYLSRFLGEVGTVVSVSYWVFGDPEDVCYLVALDSGPEITCDAEDLELEADDADQG